MRRSSIPGRWAVLLISLSAALVILPIGCERHPLPEPTRVLHHGGDLAAPPGYVNVYQVTIDLQAGQTIPIELPLRSTALVGYEVIDPRGPIVRGLTLRQRLPADASGQRRDTVAIRDATAAAVEMYPTGDAILVELSHTGYTDVRLIVYAHVRQ